MKETAGGLVARAEPDAHPVVKERLHVTLRTDRTTALLGIEISSERQADLLRKIGVDVMLDDHRIDAEIPPFRGDLEREADLIEEVARLEGFDKLGGTVPSGPGALLTKEQRAVRSLTRTLAAQGMNEAWTSSFFAPSDLDRLGLDAEHPARRLVEVSNPMVEQEGALRSTMLPGLLRSLARNAAQFTDGAGLFEIARIYEPTTGDLAAEELALAAVAGGDRLPQSWNEAAQPWDFYAAKGILEAAGASLGVKGLRYDAAARPSAPFHPTRGAVVMLGSQTIGILGELHPEVCRAFDVWEKTIVFEIALEPLLSAMPEIHQTDELPRYPSLRIDLAVVVDDRIPAEQVRDLIARAGAPELVEVRLFDLYRGEQVGEGKKSLAFSLEMRDPERTMTDEDAVVVKDRVMDALTERLAAHLR
jgi:phenylalanyl-tRNA synthetase beta chain